MCVSLRLDMKFKKKTLLKGLWKVTKTGRMTMMISRKMKNLIKKLGLKPKKLKIILKIKKQKRKTIKNKNKKKNKAT